MVLVVTFPSFSGMKCLWWYNVNWMQCFNVVQVNFNVVSKSILLYVLFAFSLAFFLNSAISNNDKLGGLQQHPEVQVPECDFKGLFAFHSKSIASPLLVELAMVMV